MSRFFLKFLENSVYTLNLINKILIRMELIYMIYSEKILSVRGKNWKTLASYLGSQGEETIIIEKSKAMYGGFWQ